MLRDALETTEELEDRALLAEIVCLVAGLALLQGNVDTATRLIGAAQAILHETARKRYRNQPYFDHVLAAIQTASVAARSSGLADPALSVGEALALTRMVVQGNQVDPPSISRLTRRETEVLQLVAKGCSDREVAEALYISRTTASHHVEAILRKLDVPTRTAAAARAIRDGLVPDDIVQPELLASPARMTSSLLPQK